MSEKTRAKPRTPAQIAIDEVEAEAKKRDALIERHQRAKAMATAIGEDLDRSDKRVRFLLMNPDLPEDYTLPGKDAELPLEQKP